MFSVIYYLLIMNWNWARTPDYDMYSAAIDSNTKMIRAESYIILEATREDTKQPGSSERITPFLNKMETIRSTTDSIYNTIEQLKSKLQNIPVSKNNSKLVQAFIKEYHLDSLSQLLNVHLDSSLKLIGSPYALDYLSKKLYRHWNAISLFESNTSTSLISILSVFQDDISKNEYNILDQIHREGGTMGWCDRVDNFKAIAIPLNPHAFPGQKVKGITMLAAYNSAIDPAINVNTGYMVRIEAGVGRWSKKSSPLGLNIIKGTASITIDTTTFTKPFSFEYFVGAPGYAMNIDHANTCYVGVENPISISVPGFETDKLSLMVKDAEVTKTAPGKFNIYFKIAPKEKVYAFVKGTNAQGTTSTVASLPIIARELPAPLATIDGATDGHIHLRHFRKATGLIAIEQVDDFDMSYTIVSYELSLLHDNNSAYIEPVKAKGDFGNNLAVLKILQLAKRGDKAIFEHIVARDENGRLIELAPVILKLY